jgi:uncharacterized membrane protein YfcA
VGAPLGIAAIAFLATLLASMSGGSASLLTTPAWLALGFSLPTAIGADKLAATLWGAVSARNYLRARPVDRPLLGAMVVVGLLGAVLGTLVTTSLRPQLLRPVVGGLILAAAVAVALRPRFGLEVRAPRLSRGAAAAAALPLGFYEGLLGSGNSVLSTLVLASGRGLDLPAALGHYYALGSAWCGLAAASYAMQGFFDPGLALPVVAGGVLGGYAGSRIGSAGGGRLVRVVFIAAGLGMGGVLLLGR